MLKIVPSLSGWMRWLHNADYPTWEDNGDVLYIFGAVKDGGYDYTLKSVTEYTDGFDPKKVEAIILPVLERAEQEGRVHWRTGDNYNRAEYEFLVRHGFTGFDTEAEENDIWDDNKKIYSLLQDYPDWMIELTQYRDRKPYRPLL